MRIRPVGTLKILSVLILSSALVQPLLAQDGATVPARPIPRLPSGEVSLEAPQGELGVWNRGDYRSIVPETEVQTALRDRGRPDGGNPMNLKPLFSAVPFQPWAETVYLYRQEHEIEPYGRCKPTGGFRNMAVPYGTDIVQVRKNSVYTSFTLAVHIRTALSIWTAARILPISILATVAIPLVTGKETRSSSTRLALMSAAGSMPTVCRPRHKRI